MFFNLIVFLLIIMITGYLANQGMLSALLALATATFSSILAMALLEPLQRFIQGWRPDYARGVTFLLLFCLAFGATRFAADYAVPKTIKLKPIYNRITGGIAGFFTALVVVGTLVLGFEMLPISRTPFGYDRFPADNHMQALDADGKPLLGEIAKPANLWLAPDEFVLALWNGASGRALGGNRAWASVHPDLSIESYGYRNHVDGSLRVLPADLLQVKAAVLLPETAKYATPDNLQVPASGKRLVMVRTQEQKGSTVGKISNDEDSYLRISASQVRLLTDKNHQYYPAGYLEDGRTFVPLTLDVGYVADDYVKGSDAVEDWIFQVDADEKPTALEVKQLARAELTGILSEKAVSPLAAAQYPPHQYYKELCTLTVTFDDKGKKLLAGRVYVLKTDGLRRDVGALLNSAYEHIIECDKNLGNNTGGWTTKGKPGVPNLGNFGAAEGYGREIKNANDDSPVNWGPMIQLLLLGQAQPDGDQNLHQMPVFFESNIVSAWKNTAKGNLIVASADSDETGRVEIKKLSASRRAVVVTLLTERGFFVWEKDIDFKPSSHEQMKVVGDSATGGTVFRTDLDENVP